MQESFSVLWENYPSDKEAMRARNKRAKELRGSGYRVTCFALPNQVKKYSGLGQPDGRSCTVYLLDYKEA